MSCARVMWQRNTAPNHYTRHEEHITPPMPFLCTVSFSSVVVDNRLSKQLLCSIHRKKVTAQLPVPLTLSLSANKRQIIYLLFTPHRFFCFLFLFSPLCCCVLLLLLLRLQRPPTLHQRVYCYRPPFVFLPTRSLLFCFRFFHNSPNAPCCCSRCPVGVFVVKIQFLQNVHSFEAFLLRARIRCRPPPPRLNVA